MANGDCGSAAYFPCYYPWQYQPFTLPEPVIKKKIVTTKTYKYDQKGRVIEEKITEEEI